MWLNAQPAYRFKAGVMIGLQILSVLLILVVEYANDPAWVRPSFQYFWTVISSAMLFICMVPSPTRAFTGRSGWANLAPMA
jgi:hypothetical protein